jgi:hypothetical protein
MPSCLESWVKDKSSGHKDDASDMKIVGVLYPGYQESPVTTNKSRYSSVLSNDKNGYGTRCVVTGLTPGRDLYQSLFYPDSHTLGTPDSITWEPSILGK